MRTTKDNKSAKTKLNKLQASTIVVDNTDLADKLVVQVSDQPLKNQSGSAIGRPTTLTPEIIVKLINYLSIGTPINKSCQLLGIDEGAIYRRIQWDKDFQKNINDAKAIMVQRARNNVATALNQGNLQLTTWYLERKERDEFGNKVEIDQNVTLGQSDNQSLTDKLQGMIRDYKGKVDLPLI